MSVLLLKHEKSHRPTFTNRTTLSVLFLRIGRNFLSYFNKHGKTKSVRSTFTERDNIVRPTHTLTNRTTFSVLLLPLQTGQYCPSYLYKQDKIPCPTLRNRTIFSVLPLQTGQHSPSSWRYIEGSQSRTGQSFCKLQTPTPFSHLQCLQGLGRDTSPWVRFSPGQGAEIRKKTLI